MTVVCWDGRTLAADKQSSQGNTKRTTTKIYRVGALLVGFAGNAGQAAAMRNWVEHGCRPGQFPEQQRDQDEWCSVLVIDGGRVVMFERTPYPIVVEDPVAAIGSGRDFAMAAMFCGLGAAEAVRVACHFDANCGMGIDAIDLAPSV